MKKYYGSLSRKTNISYDIVGSISAAGLAVVQLNDKWGAIDQSDNIIIPIIYDDISEFEYIDTIKTLTPTGISSFRKITKNDENIIALASVKLNNKYGYVDQYNNLYDENKVKVEVEHDDYFVILN